MISKNKLVVLFAILIISIGQSMDIYLPSMPSMVNALHTSTLTIQFSLTIGLIGYGSAALIYGPISDHFGRRKTALIGLMIFICASILCATATNVYLLLIGRAFQGVGFASASGVAAPAVCDVYTDQDLVKAFSYIGMAMAMMPVIAPVFGGYLHHYFNWRAPFIFLMIYGVITFILFFYWFSETNKSLKKSSIHPVDIIKNYISVICHRKYLGFIFCSVFIFSGEFSYVINAPFLFQNKLGLSSVQNGWLMLITVAGFLGGTFSSKALCNKFNIVQLTMLGCIMSVSAATIMLSVALVANMTVLTMSSIFSAMR